MRSLAEIFAVVIHYQFFSKENPRMLLALYDAHDEHMITREELAVAARAVIETNDGISYEKDLAIYQNWK